MQHKIILILSLLGSLTAFAGTTTPINSLTPTTKTAAQHQQISINQASEKELQRVKGIGVKKAAAIVTYRNQNGAFIQLNDLLKIKIRGINPKWLAKVSPFLKI